MFRARFVVAVISLLTCAAICPAQSAPSSTASCYLDDGRQVFIRYNAVSTKTDKPANGKPWAPGGTPMTLFTEAQLSFGGSTIPIGAFTVYPIPAKDKWTLVINKNVTAGAQYDEKQDLARATMETDQVRRHPRTRFRPRRRPMHAPHLLRQSRLLRRLPRQIGL
jgi:hypothetical protein